MLGLCQIKKYNKTKISLNLILEGVLSIRNTQIFISNFHPAWPGGTLGALGVHQIKNMCKTKSYHHLILGGFPIIESVEIPKF